MKEYIVQAIAQETIDSFDAHNAPELIRCKDCKYWSEDFYRNCLKRSGWFRTTPDWFCADGRRKEGGEAG